MPRKNSTFATVETIGRAFGVSSNLRTLCSMAGAGRQSDFFRIDWRAQRWNLLFAAGNIFTPLGLTTLVGGGFLVGFGAR